MAQNIYCCGAGTTSEMEALTDIILPIVPDVFYDVIDKYLVTSNSLCFVNPMPRYALRNSFLALAFVCCFICDVNWGILVMLC